MEIRDSFNQSSKVSRGKMDRLGPERSRSITLTKRVSRSFKMVDVRSLLLVMKLDDEFDFNDDIVQAISCVEI